MKIQEGGRWRFLQDYEHVDLIQNTKAGHHAGATTPRKNSCLLITRLAGLGECVESGAKTALHLRCTFSHTNVADQDDGLLVVAAYCIRQWCVFLVFWCVFLAKWCVRTSTLLNI